MKILTWIAIKEQLQNVMFLFNKNYYLKSFYLVILSSLTLLQVWMGGEGVRISVVG